MKKTLPALLAPVVCLLLVGTLGLLTSCADDEQPVPVVEEPALPPARVTDTIRYDKAKMTAYNIEYPSTDPYGQPVTLSGTITVGDEVAQHHARGLMLYNHFTVYQADQCPSHGDLTVQQLIVGSGLITVSPDYYGFGITGDFPQAYCVASANAQAAIDALIAARKLLAGMGYSWDDRLYNAGYSQGGQTTLGVVRLVSGRYPDIRFTRSFAGGGPYDIAETYRRFIATGHTDMPATVVSVMQSYNDVFRLGLSPATMFLEPLLSHLDEWFLSKRYKQSSIERLIGSEQLADFIAPAMLDLSSQPSRLLMSAVQQESLCAGWTPRADEQLTIVHNKSDLAVPVANADNLVAFLRAQGLPVTTDPAQPGVYARIEDFGAVPGLVGAHELGAFYFLVTVIDQIGADLGIGLWLTPDFSLLADML